MTFMPIASLWNITKALETALDWSLGSVLVSVHSNIKSHHNESVMCFKPDTQRLLVGSLNAKSTKLYTSGAIIVFLLTLFWPVFSIKSHLDVKA